MNQEAAEAEVVRQPARRIGAWWALFACLFGAAAAVRPAHMYYDESRANYIGEGWLAMKKDPNLPLSQQQDLAQKALQTRRFYVGVVTLLWGVGVGGFLGAIGAAVSKNPLKIVVGCLVGAAVVGAFGFVAGYSGMWLTDVYKTAKIDSDTAKLLKSMLYAGTIFAILGLGAGVAHGFLFPANEGRLRTILAGIFGGIAGGMLYIPLISVVLPGVDTTALVPKGELARLFWFAIAALAIGTALSLASQPRPAKTEQPA